MAKRGKKWKQDWFLKLTPQAKLLYSYFYDNCDHVGILEFSEVMMKVQIGFSSKVEVEKILPELDGKIEWFKDRKKLWVMDFIPEEYGVLGGSSSIHVTVLRELGKYFNDAAAGKSFLLFIKSLEELVCRVQVGYKYPNKKENKSKKDFFELGGVEGKTFLLEDVELAFVQHGGTREQAKAFWAKHEAAEWVDGNKRAIRNFRPLIPGFLQAWEEIRKNGIDKNKPGSTSSARIAALRNF